MRTHAPNEPRFLSNTFFIMPSTDVQEEELSRTVGEQRAAADERCRHLAEDLEVKLSPQGVACGM